MNTTSPKLRPFKNRIMFFVIAPIYLWIFRPLIFSSTRFFLLVRFNNEPNMIPPTSCIWSMQVIPIIYNDYLLDELHPKTSYCAIKHVDSKWHKHNTYRTLPILIFDDLIIQIPRLRLDLISLVKADIIYVIKSNRCQILDRIMK